MYKYIYIDYIKATIRPARTSQIVGIVARRGVHAMMKVLPHRWAAVRNPIPYANADVPLECRYKPDPDILAATLIFVPQYHYLDEPPVPSNPKAENRNPAKAQFWPWLSYVCHIRSTAGRHWNGRLTSRQPK